MLVTISRRLFLRTALLGHSSNCRLCRQSTTAVGSLVAMQTCWANNPKYVDGTRLRGSPGADAAFNGVFVPNDACLTVLAEYGDWVEVETIFADRGYIRRRNLSTTERVVGFVEDTETAGPDPNDAIEPYFPATSLEKIMSSEHDPSSVLKLDWNEGAIPPPPSVLDALAVFAASSGGHYLKWYAPLGGGDDLKQGLAEYVDGAITENLLVTNGSDDALILAAQTYLKMGIRALVDCPTYEHFCVNAACTGADLIRFESRDPEYADPDELAAAIQQHVPRLVYLVSPNNPTGVQWSEEQIRRLSTRFPSTMFIVDEAYHEFGATDTSTGEPMTCTSLAMETKNVMVTRTFSKGFCLASLRCGYIVAHPSTIATLRVRYNPKSVNAFASVGAAQALKEVDGYYKPYWVATCSARESFVRDLTKAGYKCKSGGGNFVSVQVPDGKGAELCTRLESERIYIRDIGGRWKNHIRISVGDDMGRVANAIVQAGKDLGVLAC